jgi:hypothetical protein
MSTPKPGQSNLDLYLLNPLKCERCNSDIPYCNSRSGKFCSKSCAASNNNLLKTQTTLDKQRDSVTKTIKDKHFQLGIGPNKEKSLYYQHCGFKFTRATMILLPGFDLLVNLGVYNPIHNKGGVTKDHIVSRGMAWANKYDPAHIRHPANCQFITNSQNSKKGIGCKLTYDQLIDRIKYWDMGIILPLPHEEEGLAIPRFNLTELKS